MNLILRGQDILSMVVNRGSNDKLKKWLEDVSKLSPKEYGNYGKPLRDLIDLICEKMHGDNWPDEQSNPDLYKLLGSFCSCSGGGSGTGKLTNKLN